MTKAGVQPMPVGMSLVCLKSWVGKYKSYDNGIHYVSPKYYKIKHKGRSNRYLGRKYVWHYYQEATPATSGYYKTVGSGKRKCGYYPNGSYYCYTTAPKRVWVLVGLTAGGLSCYPLHLGP